MRPEEVVLCVDYGTTETTAVPVDRNGGWVTLSLDTDGDMLSSAVFLHAEGSWLVGDRDPTKSTWKAHPARGL